MSVSGYRKPDAGDQRGLWLAAIVVAVYAGLLLSSLLGMPVWKWLKVPALVPVFADMRTITGAILSESHGLDPYLSNPGDPWGRQLNYPEIWVWLFKALGISQEEHFLAFVLTAIAGFLLVVMIFIRKFPSVWVALAFLSGATLLAVERGNSDVILFSMVFVACLVPALFFPGIILAGALKLFPVALAYEWLRRRRWGLVLATLLLFAGYVGYIWPTPEKIMLATPVSGSLSYGLKSMAIYLSDLQLSVLFWPCVLGSAMASVLLARQLPPLPMVSELECRLFCSGAAIYCATFMAASNFDYRLIFLILCMPALLSGRLQHGKAMAAMILLAMNYLWMKKALGDAGIFLNHLFKLTLFIYLAASLLAALEIRHLHRSHDALPG